MRILGIDLGDVRTGLALSDPTEFLASTAGTIKESDLTVLAKKVAEFIKEREVGKVVIGLPLNMNGTKGPRAEKTEDFASRLKRYTDVPVDFMDERLTTAAAYTFMNQGEKRGKKRRETVDTDSAAIILQNYLDKSRAQRK
ncbi:MAG: Holliday junction resolvase RuvX [Ruminococcaceae bacterium]|nr:Holliday junction resolvase RuvX [Oscillospiraceae bacterium]